MPDVVLFVLFSLMLVCVAGWLWTIEMRLKILREMHDLEEERYIRIRDNFERVANIERHLWTGERLLSIEELDRQRAEADAIMNAKLRNKW